MIDWRSFIHVVLVPHSLLAAADRVHVGGLHGTTAPRSTTTPDVLNSAEP